MKWYIYIICFVLIVSGIFCGLRLQAELSAASYINGSLSAQNQLSMKSFVYSKSSIEFYHDDYDTTGTYAYSVDLNPVDDFNGQKNTYQVLLNGYYLLNTQITAGSVYSIVNIDFYDTNGNVTCSSQFTISIQFLSNKTTLVVSTYGEQSASFLTQYFQDNGFSLHINQVA